MGCWVTLVYLACISLGMDIWDHHGHAGLSSHLLPYAFWYVVQMLHLVLTCAIYKKYNSTKLRNRRGSNHSRKANIFMWNLLILMTWWNIHFIGEGDSRSPLTLKPSHPTCYHIFRSATLTHYNKIWCISWYPLKMKLINLIKVKNIRKSQRKSFHVGTIREKHAIC